MAVPAGVALRLEERDVHHMGRDVRWVQTNWSRRGCSTLGWTQEQTEHELRQTQPSTTILLRQKHHDKGTHCSSGSGSGSSSSCSWSVL